jgi:hypothetical protein
MAVRLRNMFEGDQGRHSIRLAWLDQEHVDEICLQTVCDSKEKLNATIFGTGLIESFLVDIQCMHPSGL